MCPHERTCCRHLLNNIEPPVYGCDEPYDKLLWPLVIFEHAHLGSRTDSRSLRTEYCIVGIPHNTAVCFTSGVSHSPTCLCSSRYKSAESGPKFRDAPQRGRSCKTLTFRDDKMYQIVQSTGGTSIRPPRPEPEVPHSQQRTVYYHAKRGKVIYYYIPTPFATFPQQCRPIGFPFFCGGGGVRSLNV